MVVVVVVVLALTVRYDSIVPYLLANRYDAQIGDLVVGRITEVSQSPGRHRFVFRLVFCFDLDVPRSGPTTEMEGRCQLSAGCGPDALVCQPSRRRSGEGTHARCARTRALIPCRQRRKLESDELQMRTFFEEGDLLVAEVQAFFADGAMSLHTRSLKYGKVCRSGLSYLTPFSLSVFLADTERMFPKLRNGQLVIIPAVLVLRLKSHFIALPCGVDLILGLNGYIWVSKHMKDGDQGEEGFDAEAVYSSQNDVRVRLGFTDVIRSFIPFCLFYQRTSTPLPASRYPASAPSSVSWLTISSPWRTRSWWRHTIG